MPVVFLPVRSFVQPQKAQHRVDRNSFFDVVRAERVGQAFGESIDRFLMGRMRLHEELDRVLQVLVQAQIRAKALFCSI